MRIRTNEKAFVHAPWRSVDYTVDRVRLTYKRRLNEFVFAVGNLSVKGKYLKKSS